MTGPDKSEDRLRDLLRSEASTIVPAGDGLIRIRERIERRRRARLWVVPSAALATAASVGAFFLLTPDDRRTSTLEPAATPSASASAEPTVSASPVPVVPDDGGMPLNYPAIWPFTSQGEAATWAKDHPYADNGLELGRQFVEDFLGLQGITVSQPCVSCAELRLTVAGEHIGDVTLGRFGTGFASGHGTQLYTVTAVGGLDLTITSPKPGARITSPTSVTGRAGQPDENVDLRLRSQTGKELASTGAPAGREIPWTGTLTWSQDDWSHGAVVGITRSPRDGSVSRVVAVPVLRGTAAPSASFAGLVDGHVSLFDGTSGDRVRQLTYPPAGKSDVAATWSGSTLAWVRTAGASACAYELNRLQDGQASTVASSTSVRYGWPQLSPDAGTLAWIETPCAGGRETLVLAAEGKPVRRFAGPSGSVMNLFDVSDGGSMLVLTNDAAASGPGTIGVLPAGASSLDEIEALQPAAGCYLASGAAFRSGSPVAFETCGEDVRLVRFGPTGSREGTDAAMKNEPPQSISVRGERVLVHLFGGDGYGAIATYANGRFTVLLENDGSGCTSTGDGKGCVRAPDW